MGENICESPVRIVRAVQTCMACPSQWDAWDNEGNYYYLRFRHGYGEIRQYQDENWADAPWKENPDESVPGWMITANTSFIRTVATFEDDDPLSGVIELDEFCARAGIDLAEDADITGWGQHLRDELITGGLTFLLEGEGEPLSEIAQRIRDKDENSQGTEEGETPEGS